MPLCKTDACWTEIVRVQTIFTYASIQFTINEFLPRHVYVSCSEASFQLHKAVEQSANHT